MGTGTSLESEGERDRDGGERARSSKSRVSGRCFHRASLCESATATTAKSWRGTMETRAGMRRFMIHSIPPLTGTRVHTLLRVCVFSLKLGEGHVLEDFSRRKAAAVLDLILLLLLLLLK